MTAEEAQVRLEVIQQTYLRGDAQPALDQARALIQEIGQAVERDGRAERTEVWTLGHATRLAGQCLHALGQYSLLRQQVRRSPFAENREREVRLNSPGPT